MTDYRGAALSAAVSQLGQGNLAEYWSSALGKPQQAPLKLAWCGIFVLRNLHEAGLATHVFWQLGLGFLTTPERKWLLPQTESPQPGDIGYQGSPFQHHFMVESVDPDGRVHSVDGNSGAHSSVNRCTHPLGNGCVYFSIAPLIAMVGTQDTLPPQGVVHPLPTNAAVQHALNSLMLAHPLEHAFPLLLIDGVVGPKTTAAIKWAQSWFHLNPSGDIHDVSLLQKLGLA